MFFFTWSPHSLSKLTTFKRHMVRFQSMLRKNNAHIYSNNMSETFFVTHQAREKQDSKMYDSSAQSDNNVGGHIWQ